MINRYAIIDDNIVKDIIEIDESKNFDSATTSDQLISFFFSNKKIIKETKETGKAYTSWIYINNKFVMPSPFPSWIFDKDKWMAPQPYPNDNNLYFWNEKNQQWKIFLEEE